MGKLEEEYKRQLTIEYNRYIYQLAQAEMEKKDTSELFDRVLDIQKQIAALDVEIKIDNIMEMERSYKK